MCVCMYINNFYKAVEKLKILKRVKIIGTRFMCAAQTRDRGFAQLFLP
jgi:hypothetical protein